VTISRLIGCCWTLDGKAIEIQSYKANIITTFSDRVSQRCGVRIRRGIGRILDIRAILGDIASGGKDKDTTDTETSRTIPRGSPAFVVTFR